jgi:uncharacterized protein YbcI/anti-anti-sigma regulatory factor
MSTGNVTVTHCDSNGTWLVALEGDHDLATSRQLEETTQAIWPQCTVAIVDLSGAAFIDSGVVRWLLSAERRLEGFGAFTLSVVVGTPRSVATRMIELMGMSERFACYATRAEALAQVPVTQVMPADAFFPAGPPISEDDATAVQLAQISSAVLRVYEQQFGRRPDHAHSHYAGEDTIACFLQGTLTRAERRLTTSDEHQRLRDMRMLFQYSAETEFREAVERVTERTVIAFISGIDTKSDVASEIFVLRPRDETT